MRIKEIPGVTYHTFYSNNKEVAILLDSDKFVFAAIIEGKYEEELQDKINQLFYDDAKLELAFDNFGDKSCEFGTLLDELIYSFTS